MKIIKILKILGLTLLDIGAFILIISNMKDIYNFGINLNNIFTIIFISVVTIFINLYNKN